MNNLHFGSEGGNHSSVTHRFGILTTALAVWMLATMCLGGASCQLIDGLFAHAEIGAALGSPAGLAAGTKIAAWQSGDQSGH